MLEAQIQQHRVVTRARAHADRERDARYDLQPARKIVGPADPGTDRQAVARGGAAWARHRLDRKSTRLNSSHGYISYAVFCLKKKKKKNETSRPSGTTFRRYIARRI